MTKSRNLIAPRKPWQPWERALLTELYPHVEGSVIAWFCNCSLAVVYRQAQLLGLKKNTATIAAIASDRMGPDHPGRATLFQKGSTPFNKGRRAISYPGMVPTQFKKGSRPHNAAPIGTERSADGYLRRKLTNTGHQRTDWVFVHQIIWQQHHGRAMPPGHAIVFIDGDKTNLDPANLLCITKVELMARNTIHRYPQPLKDAIRLVNKLNRKIDEKQK